MYFKYRKKTNIKIHTHIKIQYKQKKSIFHAAQAYLIVHNNKQNVVMMEVWVWLWYLKTYKFLQCNIYDTFFCHVRKSLIRQAGIWVILWARGQTDWTAKSAHAEINDQRCPAGADLFCAWTNIAKFFSLMLSFFAGKAIFSHDSWEEVNTGFVACVSVDV